MNDNKSMPLKDILYTNIVLFYADYLSLRETSTPVTDNCKYYYIYNTPINSAYIEDSEPFYNHDNIYIQKAIQDLELIQNKVWGNSIHDYIHGIVNLSALGVVDAKQILKCIHYYSTVKQRKRAFKQYRRWLNSLCYTHIVVDDNGDKHRECCTRYVAHAELGTERDPKIEYNIEQYGKDK